MSGGWQELVQDVASESISPRVSHLLRGLVAVGIPPHKHSGLGWTEVCPALGSMRYYWSMSACDRRVGLSRMRKRCRPSSSGLRVRSRLLVT